MNLRVDKIRKPQGLITNARMYSIILKDDLLYLIHTGLGVNIDLIVTCNPFSGPVTIANLHLFSNRTIEKINEYEKKISSIDLDVLVNEKKYSYCFHPADISSFEFMENGCVIKGTNIAPKMILKTNKGKFKLLSTGMTDIEAFKSLGLVLKKLYLVEK